MFRTPGRSDLAFLFVSDAGITRVDTQTVDGRIVARIGSSTPGSSHDDIARLATETSRTSRSVVALAGDGVSHSSVLMAPKVRPKAVRPLLARQLPDGEAFASFEAGDVRQDQFTLAAHFVSSVRTRAITPLVRELVNRGVRVAGVIPADRLMLVFGRRFLGAEKRGLRIVAFQEPERLSLSCYVDGRAIFLRSVEGAPEGDDEMRAAFAVAEVQRTGLVVRGRFKTPDLEAAVVVDAIGALRADALAQAGERAGVAVTHAPFATETDATADLASRALAVRGAFARALVTAGEHKVAMAPCDLPAPRWIVGVRLLGAASLVAAFWIGGFRLKTEAERLRSGILDAAPSGSVGSETDEILARTAAAEDLARGLLATLPEVESRPSSPAVSAVLRALAAAMPDDVALTRIQVERTSTTARVHVDARVAGSLADARKTMRRVTAAVRAWPAVTSVSEPAVSDTNFAFDPAVAQATTSVAFDVSWEAAQ